MTAQVLFFNVFFEKDPHLNAVECYDIHFTYILYITINFLTIGSHFLLIYTIIK